MALTPRQARDKYIVDSIGQYFVRRIQSAYNTEAALTSGKPEDYSKPLRIVMGKPDDPNIVTNPPVIAIDVLESTERDREYGVGTSTGWRHMNFVFYCYPSLNSYGSPSLNAAMLLRTYVRDSLGGKYIQIIDYSNPSFNPNSPTFCTQTMEIVNVTDPMNRGQNTTLALERHRFDVHLEVRYPVDEVLTST